MDGGVLTNQASHHVDLLEYMMGDVESVFAKSTTALVNIEAEDTAIVTLKFRNGALGIIEATTAVRPKDLEGSISILGETGTVEIGGFAVNKMLHWNFTHKKDGDDEVMEKYSVNPPNVYGFGHQAYYEHVVDSILNNKKHLSDIFFTQIHCKPFDYYQNILTVIIYIIYIGIIHCRLCNLIYRTSFGKELTPYLHRF